MMGWRRASAAAAMLILAAAPASAQFGQNKVAYGRFAWRVYPSPHFDVHYYGSEETYLQEVVSYAESAYLRISRELDHEIKSRIPLVLYRTHADFEQTNITLEEIPEAVGAFAEPVRNRMVVPVDQPPDKLYALIAHELTHIFQYSIFFEGYLGRALRSSPPLWLMEGMASYLGQDEDNVDRMVIRDAVVNNFVPPIQELSRLGFLTYRFGHAVFDFIEQEHGKEGLRSFIFEYRKVLLTNNLPKAVREAFGLEMDEFNRRFNRFLRKKYLPLLLDKKAPEDYGKEIGLKKEGVFTFSPTPSPSGELVAVLASPKMELDLLVLSAQDGSVVRNLTKGWTNRWRYLIAEAFAGKRDLSWSPSGDLIAVFAQREASRPLLIFDALTRKLVRRVPLPGIAQCASPAFSPDGRKVAFEGNRDGVVDIFEVDLESREIRNLTQDDEYDANPWYAPDGRSVLYNRRVGTTWKIFTVDATDASRKTQLTFGAASDVQPAFSRDGGTVFFASDRGPHGVYNIHALDLASGEIRQYTDTVGGCFSPVEIAERDGERTLAFAAFFGGTFRLFRMPLRQPEATLPPPAPESGPPPADTSFEPPVELTLDADKFQPYKVKWSLDAPYVSVGVTDDGTILGNAYVSFTDLLGDHRIQVLASTVSTFSNTDISYLNLKRRLRWGASVFDYRDYYVRLASFGGKRDQIQRTTGLAGYLQYPLNRHYRIDGTVSLIDRAQDYVTGVDVFGIPTTDTYRERFLLLGVSLTGDTTRYREFGPFQGKRFTVAATYGAPVGGDSSGGLLEYTLDFRAYKQVTRRSLFAWRFAGAWSAGGRETYYALGGINQLRGYDFRDFFGSRVFWSNLEFRFPLVDLMQFPVLSLRSIRGFLFLDAGAAWFKDGSFYDPELQAIRIDPSTCRNVPLPLGRTGRQCEPAEFKFWDSEEGRLQDGRGSYGMGFQFLFLGGLQFNWSWAWRLPFTQYVPSDPFNPFSPLQAIKGDTSGARMDFYVIFDF